MAHPMLETMLRNQIAALVVCQSTTHVEYQDDPDRHGRTVISIKGPTREAVQAQIDIIHRKVDDADNGGYARFIGPRKGRDGYAAAGEIVLFDEVPE